MIPKVLVFLGSSRQLILVDDPENFFNVGSSTKRYCFCSHLKLANNQSIWLVDMVAVTTIRTKLDDFASFYLTTMCYHSQHIDCWKHQEWNAEKTWQGELKFERSNESADFKRCNREQDRKREIFGENQSRRSLTFPGISFEWLLH